MASTNESLQRWYFTPNYDCVRVADDDMAMELVGQGVKLVGAGEVVAATGVRVAGGSQSKASSLYCQAFTANYPQIALRSPVYGQLKNLIDLAVAAAFIQKQDYYGAADWKMVTLGDERQFPVETFEAPKTVEPAANAVFKGNRLMTPIGGGVEIGIAGLRRRDRARAPGGEVNSVAANRALSAGRKTDRRQQVSANRHCARRRLRPVALVRMQR